MPKVRVLTGIAALVASVLAATAVAGAAPTTAKTAATGYDDAAGAQGARHPVLSRVQTALAVPVPAILAPPDVIVGEADGQVDLVVRLADEGIDPVTVSYATANSTASSATLACPSDFVAPNPTPGTLHFDPGETEKTVSIMLRDCTDVEGLVSFRFNLSSPTNATIARASTLVGIVDRSTAAATPRLFVRDAIVDQKDGVALVPVLLGGPGGQSSSSTVTVNYATSNRTAAAGTDYTATAGTLTFAPGQTAKTVVVPILDAGPKASTSFSVGLSNPTNATIADDAGVVAIGASAALPQAQPTVSAPADLVIGEGDGYVDLPVRLSTPGTDAVSVSYSLPGSTATSGTGCDTDYASSTGSLTFAPGQTTKVVRVQLIDCAEVDGLVSFRLNLASPVNATIARASTLVSIVNNSSVVASPRLFARDAVVDEKDGFVLVPVLLGGPAGHASTSLVTVDYATSNGTATAGTDYTAVAGTLTFAPGETAKTIVVPILDSGAHAQRNFALGLSNVTNATLADETGVVVIGASAASAVATPTVLAPIDVVAGEGDGYVDLAVRLSAPGLNAVRVTYATANSTASAGPVMTCSDDYVSNSGELNFAPGETTKVVRMQLLDCPDVDGLVSFRLNLTAPINATLARASTLVSIVNNSSVVATPWLFVRDAVVDEKDGSVLVPVLLGGPGGQSSGSTVRVDYTTVNRTATAGTDYTAVSGTLSFAPGETVKTVVVPILDPPGNPARSFALSLANPTNATLADGTGLVAIGASSAVPVSLPSLSAPPDVVVGEGDGYVDLVVRLSAPGLNPVSVTYATSNATATAGSACNSDLAAAGGSLTFAPGETTKAVRVQLLDCPDADGFASFPLSLTAPINATLADASSQISIVNNSSFVVTPSLFVRDALVDEKDGSVLVPVMLGGPAGQSSPSTVTVDYTTVNGTAVAGTDYTAVSGTLSFAPGQTVKTVAIPILDPSGNPSRSFALSLSNAANATVADGTGMVVIAASAAVAVAQPLLSAPADVVVGEADGYVDLPVRLSAPGLSPISVAYLTAPSTATIGTDCPNDIVSAGGTLNFAPGETMKVVRVQLLDCGDMDVGGASFRFGLNSQANATIARANTLVTVVNNSTVVATPRLVVRDAVADEKDGFVLVPVILGGPAGQASDSMVTVDYTTSDGTATAGVHYTAVSGTLRFAPGQTVQTVVVPLLDPAANSSTSFALTLSGVTNASVTDATGIVVIGASAASAATLPAISAPPDISVDEADGYVDLPVRLSAPGVTPVSVTYGTSNGTAVGGTTCDSDYVAAANEKLNFAPGETTKVVRVQLLNCTDVEGVVTFRVNLSVPANATIARSSVLVSISNDASAWTPNNLSLPTVSGTFQGGQLLTAAPGTWTGAPTGYQFSWQRCNASGALCGTIDGAVASTYTLTPADDGHAVRVEVTATNAIGTSLPAYSMATPLILSLPGQPLNVSASEADGQATVSFTPPAQQGGGGITYTVTSSPGNVTATGSSSPIVVTGLTNGTTYTFTVTATNAAGVGPTSAPSNAVTPARRPSSPPDPPPAVSRPPVPDFTVPPPGTRKPVPPH